ncbi:Protein of unknown function [Pyronema omphalodes CBS 100304]|uniref:Uncharacterized protein n=1 Tax=Pyronema omphalodes (strain CBS 100304) TaxID=1076935 RepID=U4KU15_PYROM|nr:Protein of unknown function [Pyronema omphalodes CBS 100304]
MNPRAATRKHTARATGDGRRETLMAFHGFRWLRWRRCTVLPIDAAGKRWER